MRNNKSIFVDGRLLEVFCVVAEELHFGRAADRLFISQSALSQQIKKLEATVNASLFLRTTRSVHLTLAGEVMHRHTKTMRSSTEHMLQQVQQAARGKGGRLTVGMTPTAACWSLADGLYQFGKQRPEIELDVVELNSVEMPAALRRHSVDVGLMRPTSFDADIAMSELYTECLVVAVRTDDALARRRGLSLNDIAQRPLISYRQEISPYFRKLVHGMFIDAGIVPNIIKESFIPTILTFVEAGMGLAIVPESLAHLRGARISFLPLVECAEIRASTMVAKLARQENLLVDDFLISIAEHQRTNVTKKDSKLQRGFSEIIR